MAGMFTGDLEITAKVDREGYVRLMRRMAHMLPNNCYRDRDARYEVKVFVQRIADASETE